MAKPAVVGTYGGIKVNAEPVSNPTSQIDVTHYNRANEDLAHLTRTAPKAIALFAATGTAAPTTVAASGVSIKSQWGSGSAQKPTVTKSADGLYALAFAASYVDDLGASEVLGFFDAEVDVRTGASNDSLDAKVLSVTASGATIALYSPAGTLADLGNNSGSPLSVSVRFY